MPVIVHRQPWFWAVLIAVAAVLVFVVVIAASGPRDTESNTIVTQPAPPAATVPVPVDVAQEPPPEPVRPEEPQRPAEPAKPAPPVVVKEKETVVIREVPRDRPAEPATFRDTGMPRDIRFARAGWRAVATEMFRPEDLQSIGKAEDGTEMFARMGAVPPFQRVYAAVPDEAEKYVAYEIPKR